MLGFEVAQSTVSNYMVRRRSPPSQSWKTFLRSHGEAIAAIDMCVVPTVTFELLFAFLVVGHGRRHLLWFEVTRRPTAEWLARQITEAFLWASAPTYLVRDNDRAYGLVFRRRARVMGIRDRPNFPEFALAKWDCGTSHRHLAARVPRPNAGFWRNAPTANSLRLCGVLQSGPHPYGVTEGRPFTSGRPAKRDHYRHTRSVGSSSSVRADMIFGKDRLGGRCGNLRCTKPWAASSGYGDWSSWPRLL